LREPSVNIFNAKEIEISNDRAEYVTYNEKGFAASLEGILIFKSKRQGILKIGDYSLNIDDELPGDSEVGDFIKLSCSRIDLY
jgi:hypothetical protein